MFNVSFYWSEVLEVGLLLRAPPERPAWNSKRSTGNWALGDVRWLRPLNTPSCPTTGDHSLQWAELQRFGQLLAVCVVRSSTVRAWRMVWSPGIPTWKKRVRTWCSSGELLSAEALATVSCCFSEAELSEVWPIPRFYQHLEELRDFYQQRCDLKRLAPKKIVGSWSPTSEITKDKVCQWMDIEASRWLGRSDKNDQIWRVKFLVWCFKYSDLEQDLVVFLEQDFDHFRQIALFQHLEFLSSWNLSRGRGIFTYQYPASKAKGVLSPSNATIACAQGLLLWKAQVMILMVQRGGKNTQTHWDFCEIILEGKHRRTNNRRKRIKRKEREESLNIILIYSLCKGCPRIYLEYHFKGNYFPDK